MPIFHYSGRAQGGEAVQGSLEAASDGAAAAELAASGIVPIRIAEVAEQRDLLGPLLGKWRQGKIGLSDLVIFSRQMYSLTRAGVPLIRALGGLADTARSPAMAQVLRDISDRLESGHGLAAAMQQHPRVFSRLIVSLVHAGEESGRLEEAFLRIAGYLELDQQTRKRLQSATRYPMIVLGAIAAALVVLNIFVIPSFAGVFASFGAELPWATRLLIGTSAFCVNYWPHMLVVGVGALFGARRYLETTPGRLRWDRFKLRLPGVGSIFERALLARFARTLAMTLRSGVPITRGLGLVARAVDNQHVARKIAGMRDSIERGEDLMRSARQSGLFTPLVLQMLAVGEETGNVEDLLEEVADFYEREVDHDLKQIGDLIEPVLIIAIGVAVLVLALGIYLPMWDLAGAARGG